MVPCPVCSSPVDWLTVTAAAEVLGVTDGRVRQFVLQGRFPNAVKVHPDSGMQPIWTIPIADVLALKAAREETS